MNIISTRQFLHAFATVCAAIAIGSLDIGFVSESTSVDIAKTAGVLAMLINTYMYGTTTGSSTAATKRGRRDEH